MNVLCLWFVSQIFFNEKTTFLTFFWLVEFRPDRLLLIYFVAHVLLLSRRRHLVRLKLSKEEILMLLFFAVIFVSCVVTGAFPLNYHLSTVFSFIGFPMFTFWLCRRIPFQVSNVTRLASVLIAMGGYLGLCGIFEHYDWPHFIFPDYIFDPSMGIHFGRSRGPFLQAHIFGGVLCVIALMTAWFLRNSGATRTTSAIALTILGLVFASIYLTDTRAVWLDLAVAVFVLAVTRNGMQWYAYRTVLVVLAIFLSGVLSKFSLYEVTLFGRRNEAAQSRVVLADASVALIKEQPILGSGYGTFATAGDDFLVDREQRRLVLGEGNHNTFLGLTVETGLLGTLPYMLILTGFLLRGIRLWRMSKDDRAARDFAAVAVAGLLGYLCLIQFGDVRFFTLFNCLVFAIYGFVFAWADNLENAAAGRPHVACEQPSSRVRLSSATRTPRTGTRALTPR